MKYYESHYEEYIESLNKYNIHPNLLSKYKDFPKNISKFGNMVVYGPSGSGKYTQVLNIIRKYSQNDLKYDKKITIHTEKQDYTYHISDVHYEIDMSLLGCNAKILWHEIFLQIVDILSVKNEKVGIILCKNFHTIHKELLDIFYSYLQHFNHDQSIIKIHFILLTEHVSFIPNNILKCCEILKIPRPSKKEYSIISNNNFNSEIVTNTSFINRINNIKNKKTISDFNLIDYVDIDSILNAKEVKSFDLIQNIDDVPKDIFNKICDSIIQKMISPDKIVFTAFRDIIYDILIYNLDVTECIWYLIQYFIENEQISKNDISDILNKTFTFLKYYNNNYRPIHHLESILFYFIIKIHNIKQ